MKSLLFALKRLLTTPWFALFLLLILSAPLFAQRAAADTKVPSPAYYIDGNEDTDASRIAEYLEKAGFIPAASEDALRKDVAAG